MTQKGAYQRKIPINADSHMQITVLLHLPNSQDVLE